MKVGDKVIRINSNYGYCNIGHTYTIKRLYKSSHNIDMRVILEEVSGEYSQLAFRVVKPEDQITEVW